MKKIKIFKNLFHKHVYKFLEMIEIDDQTIGYIEQCECGKKKIVNNITHETTYSK